jgi:hypothetical protein
MEQRLAAARANGPADVALKLQAVIGLLGERRTQDERLAALLQSRMRDLRTLQQIS